MANSGIVKSFNDGKGWGFVQADGVEGDVFLHVKECQDGRPQAGDQISFDMQEDPVRKGQLQATNVTGCTGDGKGGGKGNSSRPSGTVKSFNDTKGWGFLDYNGADVFLHVKECLDGRPQAGDVLSFDLEDDDKRAGQLQAKKALGCTGGPPGREGGLQGKGKGKGMMGGMMAGPQPLQVVSDGYGGFYQLVPLGPGYGYGGGPPMMSPGYGGGKSFGKGKPKGGGGAGGGGGGGRGKKHGQVKSFNDGKGWGFIDLQGEDVFLHVKDCEDGRPVAGDHVSFDVEPDNRGQLKALNVTGCTGEGQGMPGMKGGGFGAAVPRAGPYGGGAGGSPLGRKGGFDSW